MDNTTVLAKPTTINYQQNDSTLQGTFENFKDFIGWGTAAKERQYNAEQAQLQRDWEEYMSNTSYQRAIKDMEAAGINPALAITNGGASTPTATNAKTGTTNGALAQNITAAANLIKAINQIDINNKEKIKPNDVISTAASLMKILS